ncbi:MAG TPA: pirin family protein, partial [Candidatus Binatia bacterium]|nr:pirin family protein [Candidatus Binatia bacterium]
MISIRRAAERGRTRFDWLDSRHTFSFGEYRDPRYMGFRTLRVINDDRVAPGEGFATHSHRDMEIITYVLDGAIAHKDSTGTATVIRPGEAQRMSAGTGISHSEYNPSKADPVRFLQIWIIPETQGLKPEYEQRSFDLDKNLGGWVQIAANEPRDGAVKVHQDVEVAAARLTAGQQATYRLKPGRHAWVQVAVGTALLNGAALAEGDGAAVSGEEIVEVAATEG